MGRPAGSPNKDKPFKDALRAELADAEGDFRKLRGIARAMIEKAESGDVQAAFQIRDTLDGKPAQAIVGEDGGPIQVSVVRFTDDA